jgi:hypothetical protein
VTAGFLLAVVVAAASPTPRPTPHATGTPAPKPTEPADLAANISGGTILFILIAVAVIGYVISIRLNPNTKCRRCNGRGFHRGAIFSYSTRACSSCGGRGVKPRLGRRVFMSDNS